jgi:hypothetical protein
VPTLLETLGAPPKRTTVIADMVRVIDDEVASKGGLSGLAIKGAYRLVKGFKPGFVEAMSDAMLDDFCRNLQPIVDDARARNQPIGAFFQSDRSRVAEALLAITDQRAQRSPHGSIKAAYERLRGIAKKNVEEAVPRIGTLIAKHAA